MNNEIENYKLYEKAFELYKNEQYQEAEEILRNLVKRGKYDKYVLFLMAKIRLKLNDEKSAQKYLEESVKLFPKDIYSHLELGRVYELQGNYKEAENQYRRSIRIEQDRRTFKGRLELGRLYVKLGKYDLAEAHFQIHMEKEKEPTAHIRLEYGRLCSKLGRLKEAEKLFKEAIEIENGSMSYGYLELGRLYSKMNRTEDAEKTLKKCVELEKDKRSYGRLELGRLYCKVGNLAEAEKLFKEGIELEKDNLPYLKLELARLYSIQGKDDEAERLFSYIIDNLADDSYDEHSAMSHIIKHTKNDVTKIFHGVFKIDVSKVMDIIKNTEPESKLGYMFNIYCVEAPKCGYEGGKKGNGHILNYITYVTFAKSKKIITAFPSDNILDKVKIRGNVRFVKNKKKEIER